MKNLALKEKLIDTFNKDKKVFVFVIAGLLGILLIVISEINFESEENATEKNTNQIEAYEYCDYLEKKVAEIVSSIDGAGSVKVMITLSESIEYVYAQNQNDTKKVNENSENSDNKSDFVIIENDDNDAAEVSEDVKADNKDVSKDSKKGEAKDPAKKNIAIMDNDTKDRIKVAAFFIPRPIRSYFFAPKF